MTLQEGLEDIGQYCFYDTAIKEIKVPQSVKTIGISAFEFCEHLESARVPRDTSIGTDAFRSNCEVIRE